ncbi:MAG TPA: 4-hydroxy-tetrahydrodipicolinate reductase [Firmicutes bacterium]|nr:4-hydroxy-tetrahydrodipicolinate reductase [Bacillota bacterium]
MGSEVVRAVSREPDMEIAGAVDMNPRDLMIEGADGNVQVVRVTSDLEEVIARLKPHVIVDFTRPDAVMDHVRAALQRGVRAVVGTTGISMSDIEEVRQLCSKFDLGAIIAPNFAIGAVLMMKFAEMAARYLPRVEVIELHHDGKLDSPSGTAIKTAQMIHEELIRSRREAGAPIEHYKGDKPAGAIEKVAGARGAEVEGIRIHSVRLPGLVAHQEVIFGGPGQILTIRHDSISRESFMPGVIMAIRRVMTLTGVIYGLEGVLGL